jgi:hypothetical protein
MKYNQEIEINQEYEIKEFKLHISNLNPQILSVLLRETKWYSMAELEIKYNTPITFIIKIPHKEDIRTKNETQIKQLLINLNNVYNSL